MGNDGGGLKVPRVDEDGLDGLDVLLPPAEEVEKDLPQVLLHGPALLDRLQ